MNKDILQNYLNSFINQEDQQAFFNGLADYVAFVLEDADGERIAFDILRMKEVLLNEKTRLEEIVAEEIEVGKKVDIEMGLKPRVSNDMSDYLANRVLYSKTSPQLSEVEKKIKDGQEMAIWGAWDKIQITPDSKPDRPVKAYKPYINRVHNYLLRKFSECDSDKSILGGNIQSQAVKDAVFTMTYDSKYRKLFINGQQVRKFGMDSENSKIFEDAFNNPNQLRQITSERRAQDFVNAFGFRDRAKDLFFPTSSGDKLILNNPVSKNDLKKLSLEHITLDDLIGDIR